jgi:16S rRNA (guanine966-N2)-methyltransferase
MVVRRKKPLRDMANPIVSIWTPFLAQVRRRARKPILRLPAEFMPDESWVYLGSFTAIFKDVFGVLRFRSLGFLLYCSRMRIIGGSAAGRILKAPSGYDVRPTPDLVKQAIFNRLSNRIAGARILELFAGTGALSLECLSRGASQAVCVEKSHRHAGFIQANLKLCRLEPTSLEIRIQDVFTAIDQLAQAQRVFDLLFADPPYGEKNLGRRSQSFAQKLLDYAGLPTVLDPHGVFILGHSKRDTLEIPDCWTEQKCMRHGDSLMLFLGRSRDIP